MSLNGDAIKCRTVPVLFLFSIDQLDISVQNRRRLSGRQMKLETFLYEGSSVTMCTID